uniref:Reverse transcriptase Ty1/copia-type domain-containing protein n=1 Tax=Physcomitrium patens TaxID=3218 RepID=A0A2K1IEH7_PHYPA|nr:hypothetical protein PHYPA_029833 [Physcomitrium patens]
MTQKTYVDNILKVFGIENYTPATTLIDEKLKFNTNIEEEEVDEQLRVVLFSSKAEYRALIHTSREAIWLMMLLQDL